MAYRKSISALKKDRKREWSRRAVAAKARKRIERTESMRDVGGFTTDGILGAHTIRFLSYGDGELHYAVTVDGQHRQARTYRGILRLIAKMVSRKAAK